MSNTVGQRNARWMQHRAIAHTMRGRGQSLDSIADHLRVSKRSVARYLAAPRPQPAAPDAEVELDSFFMDGACGSFPEFDWLSRSPRVQAECKAICRHCPVLVQCRTYGLTKGRDEVGVWGGMTTLERQRDSRGLSSDGGATRRVGRVADSSEQGAA